MARKQLNESPQLRRFDDAAALDATLAITLVALMRADLAALGKASLALSGGSTPRGLLRCLSSHELDWRRIWLTLVDERWVEPASNASNEKLLRDELLHGPGAAAHLIGLKTAAPDPRTAQARLARTLADLPETLSAVVLGMGVDGHTASFFADSPGLVQALDLNNRSPCQAMRAPCEPRQRMSLTLSRILAARKIFLHFTGTAKLAVYQRALQAPPGDFSLPVSAVLQQRITPVDVYWHP